MEVCFLTVWGADGRYDRPRVEIEAVGVYFKRVREPSVDELDPARRLEPLSIEDHALFRHFLASCHRWSVG